MTEDSDVGGGIGVGIASLACLVVVALVLCDRQLRRVMAHYPTLPARSEAAAVEALGVRVAVVIPMYNEADNVEACLTALLQEPMLQAGQGLVCVVNDQSTDDTWAIAQRFQQAHPDFPLQLLDGKPRPDGEVWVGKNWACVQAVEHLQQAGAYDFLLFMDADVRVGAGAIAAALADAQTHHADLLSCGPALECGCLAEWLVQPIMLLLLLISFDSQAVNDPASETAFAAGPFMLFRRACYDAIGGHRSVADQVVEDVELARRIKAAGFRIRFLSGASYITVRMYRSWGALWEGWTKNIFEGSRRNLVGILALLAVVFGLCVVPWLLLGALVVRGAGAGWTGWDGLGAGLVAIALAVQYDLRHQLARSASLSPRYWWLTGVGGGVVMAIVLGSVFKTVTGIGWTWRGRSLKSVNASLKAQN